MADEVCNRILRPGFFMENFDGFIGSITTAVLKAGLDASTTNGLIVSRVCWCRSSIARLTSLSRRTILEMSLQLYSE